MHRPTQRPRLLLFLLLATVYCTCARAQENVTFTFVGEDDFIFCVADSAQTITVSPDPGRTLVELTVIWIVGQTDPIVSTNPDQLTFSFIYPVGDLEDVCRFDPSCDGVRCFDTRVLALYDDSPNRENVTRTISYRRPPELEIRGGGTYCVGQTATLRSTLCPTGDPTAGDVTWALPDGSTVTDVDQIDFPITTPGNYTFRVSNTNECGTGSATTTIQVIDEPVVEAIADSNVVDATETDYRLCFDGTATIRINGNGSTGLTGRQWSVSPFATIEDRTGSVTRATFTRAGTYTFTLRGNNTNCNLNDEDAFTVEVIETDVLTLNEQEDDCISIDYTPTPLNPAATYTVDGMTVANADFPITLGIGQHTVLVTLPDDGICPTQPLVDTFTVIAEATASITAPVDTVCDRDDAITYVASPAIGGTWRIDGTPFNGTVNPGAVGAGTYTITYGNEPCLADDAVTLTILNSQVSVPATTDLCIDESAVDFSALVTPTGGVFSGAGISPEGLFDPGAAGVGAYDLTYTFTNAADPGCSGAETFRVNVAELTADFTTGDCTGDQVCFELPTGTGFDRVTWVADGAGTSNSPNPCFDFPGQGTYQVEVTVERGPCSATATRSITIAPAPLPAFTLDFDPDGCSDLLVAINNNSGGGGDPNYEWTLNGQPFSTVPNPDPLTLSSVLQDSTWEIGLSLGNACETNAAPVRTVVTKPQPTARFGAPLDRYCSGDTIPLLNTSFGQVTGYRWELDGVTIGNDSIPPFLRPETDEVQIIELCLFAENDCDTDTLCQELTIDPTIVRAGFNAGTGRICAGDTLRLRNLATNGVPVRYELGDGRVTTEAQPAVVYDTPGTYLIRQRASGICGSREFELEITVEEAPVADFSPVVGCPGVSVQFDNLSTPDRAVVWDFGDGSEPVSASTPRHRFSAEGQYTVCLTVPAAVPGGCAATRCREIEIFAAPTAGFTVTDSVCVGEEITLATTAVDVDCRYSFGDGDQAEGCLVTHAYQLSSTFPVTQIVTDSRGCMDTITQPVFARPLPEPSFEVTQAGCSPDTVAFQNTTPLASAYDWSFGVTGAGSTQTSPEYVYADAGTFTVRLRATGPAGLCQAERMQEVTIREAPQARISADRTQACDGEAIGFTSSATGDVEDIFWDFGDGTRSFEAEPPPHIFPGPGTYTVLQRAQSDAGCQTAVSLEAIIHPAVLARTQVQGEVECNGEATGALSVEVEAGAAPFSLDWSNGRSGPSITDLPAGVYTVLITDSNGCRREVTDSITEPAPLVSAAAATTVTCFGGSDGRVTLAASGGTGPYDIIWPGGIDETVVENLSAGQYPVTITDANGCETETSVTVPQNPELRIIDSLAEITCFGDDDGAYVLRDISGGVRPYLFSLTGTGYSESGSTAGRFDGLRPGFYTFNLEDSLGCATDLEFELVEPDEVRLDILDDTIRLSLGDQAPLDNRFNAADPTFSWSPFAGLDCFDCPTPIVRPFAPLTTYTGSVTDARGCNDRDSVTVIVSIDRDVYIPNTFTPNQDGRNDLFRVRSGFVLGIDAIESFEIFDRWGNAVFEQRDFPPNDPEFGWDGRHNGKMVQIGVYVYQVVIRYVDGERIVRSGEVEILR